MADKEEFIKEIRNKITEWNKIINELRAEAEEMLKNDRNNIVDFCNKIQSIYDKYLEARRKLEDLAKSDDVMWEKHRANIQKIMEELNRLWEICFE